MTRRNFYIFANAALGKGLSGGDRIFIEFAKRLKEKNKVVIQVWDDGFRMCKRQGLDESDNLKFDLINVNFFCNFGFFICYVARILASCFKALFISLQNNNTTVVYSASEFWMDSLPAFILKLRFPRIIWVAAWFQTAPNPLIGFSKGRREKRYKLSAFYHWFVQMPIKPLIEKWADFVLVNNEEEKEYFPVLNKKNKTLVILGAVNVEEIEKWKQQNKKYPFQKKFTAVFQGRFHPQKGVVELINIWKKVCEKIPEAKLAMIGDGPLMKDVILNIKNEKLEKNIKTFGYIFDGPFKYKIFSQSKMVLHPAFFDSGGMASAEAMVFGLPCIGFNLSSYKSYYPRGMIKVETGDIKKFSDEILELIKNKSKRDRIGQEAEEMIKKSWSWDQRVNQLLSKLSN